MKKSALKSPHIQVGTFLCLTSNWSGGTSFIAFPHIKNAARINFPAAFFFQRKERLEPIKPALPRSLDLLTGLLGLLLTISIVCGQSFFLCMSTDFRHIGEIIHDVRIAPPSWAIVVHVPEHIPQIQLMFGKEPTAIFHFLDRFLGILAVRVGLPQSSEEFQSLLCRRRRPVTEMKLFRLDIPTWYKT